MQDPVLPSGEVVKFLQENQGSKLLVETNGKFETLISLEPLDG